MARECKMKFRFFIKNIKEENAEYRNWEDTEKDKLIPVVITNTFMRAAGYRAVGFNPNCKDEELKRRCAYLIEKDDNGGMDCGTDKRGERYHCEE